MLATLLHERYCGPNAPTTETAKPANDGALPPSDPTVVVQNPRYYDPDFENLIKLLTDMDARTGRPDPSKRGRGKPVSTATKKKR